MKYLDKVKEVVLNFLKDEPVRILLFGSAVKEKAPADIDIGIIPEGEWNRKKLTLLREKIESSNIPYKVEIVDLSSVSADFKREAERCAVLWR
jgi:hypothetical protein